MRIRTIVVTDQLVSIHAMNVILILNRSEALFVGTKVRRICDENCANGENFAVAAGIGESRLASEKQMFALALNYTSLLTYFWRIHTDEMCARCVRTCIVCRSVLLRS